LFKQIGDSRLPHFFRKKLKRGCGFFSRRRHRITLACSAARPKSLFLALPEQTELRRIARRLREAEMAEGV
jgi:hypothetical protein